VAKGRSRGGLVARSSDRTLDGSCSARRPAPDSGDQRTVCLSTTSPPRAAPFSPKRPSPIPESEPDSDPESEPEPEPEPDPDPESESDSDPEPDLEPEIRARSRSLMSTTAPTLRDHPPGCSTTSRSRDNLQQSAGPRAGTASIPNPPPGAARCARVAKGRSRGGLVARSSDRTLDGSCSARRPAPDSGDQRTVCLSTTSPPRAAPFSPKRPSLRPTPYALRPTLQRPTRANSGPYA